ncbi:alpha-1,4-glucan--maltose-1-phosphate maltosyltransferase [Salinibacter sp. 10B]|uniref:alpha-1,4-glucan--maltose-1-phosphate maltosyltransferase n=1 Tax=Salinibacter sp. 10B TaxID=1923971 RepID=UPI000CF3D1F4|nr:alpha-1,4-glucan--maltose-1-phosphate maltosyltransferase [Salinibacter sp. 10B]
MSSSQSSSAAASTRTSDLPKSWSRVVITSVHPTIDGGRWPIKRAVGEHVEVTAGVIVDSHEALAVELVHRHEDESAEHVSRMSSTGNDEFVGAFEISDVGRYFYRIRAWINRFATWQDQFRRRVEGGEPDSEIESELKAGADLLAQAAENAPKEDEELLEAHIEAFENGNEQAALGDEIAELVRRHAPHDQQTTSATHEVLADPELARFGAWYEFFPRSAGDSPGEHATLDEAAERLPRIKEMGFDIVYLPPIHPIGETNRKGKDNAPEAEPGDPGSPWAIGGFLEDGSKGGHKSVHPKLGGIEAFDRFVDRANELGLEVALDIAFQTSPDHPYVEDHPEWFYHRPDGTIRYAENPPKKYQDVHPINFENEDWPALWHELKSIFEHWIEHGVTTFRVDNPHTKPFAFWQWCLRELRKDTPELIVLSEAFTRPKTMYSLAKLGFNNSYTYFTWRNSSEELMEYGRELFQTEVAEYFRPNFWPNTPDILHDDLVHGGRPAHKIRFVLAATMSSTYGVYGPPFEHVFNEQHPDREEYAQNEKYEIRSWDWDDPTSLQPFISRVNRIREENPALQQMRNIRFHDTQNPEIIAYSKSAGTNLVLVVSTLDPHHAQEGQLVLPNNELGLPVHDAFPVHDLLQDARYTWRGSHHFLRLTPDAPAHIFRIERDVSNETSHPVYDRLVHA